MKSKLKKSLVSFQNSRGFLQAQNERASSAQADDQPKAFRRDVQSHG